MSLCRNCKGYVAAAALVAIVPLWADNGAKGDDGSRVGTLVVVGDSLSAGFQNFSLYENGQAHGYAAVIATQAGANVPLPLFSSPGIPPALTLTSTGQIVRAPGIGAREDASVQAHNISVPGFTVGDALAHPFPGNPAINPIDALSDLILATPGIAVPGCGPIPGGSGLVVSEAACAVALKPNTILVSIGNNDALQALTFGLPPTDTATFRSQYGQLLGALASTGANIVLTNIPNVTDIPFLIPVPVFKQTCSNPAPPLPAGVTDADFVVPNILDPTLVTLDICTDYAVRPATLVGAAAQAVTDYNSIIAAEAQIFGAVVVDFNAVLADIARKGYEVGGQRLTTAFLGGLFSLDGIHPTNTGYAILANEVIKTMNRELHTGIPPVSVEQVMKTDPLVFGKH